MVPPVQEGLDQFLAKRETDMFHFGFLVAILKKQNSRGCSPGHRKSQLKAFVAWPPSSFYLLEDSRVSLGHTVSL